MTQKHLNASFLCLLYGASWLAAGATQVMPWHAHTLTAILAIFLIVLSLIDFSDGVLPDFLTLPLIAIGLISAWWFQFDSVGWRLISAVVGGGIIVAINLAYRRARGVDGIGYGDAKLFAASGAWLGLYALPSVLLWACGSALLVMLWRAMRAGGVTRSSALAFGPHLALGTWFVWLFGAMN